MILFNSDLDNTLIYSYKREINEEKCCVEIYQKREVSFMSNTSIDLLHKLCQRICFVPTTTRTIEQYQRINLGIGIPEYALVCNGGILLVNGVIDPTWYEESLVLIKECQSELQHSIELLKKDPNCSFEIRFIEDLFVFTKSDNPDITIEYLSGELNLTLVDIFHNGTKVYVMPQKLTKGNAILRLKDKLMANTIIAAGDSEFDISMLNVADIALAPKQLMANIYMKYNNSKNANIIVHEGEELFSNVILKYIMQYISKNEM